MRITQQIAKHFREIYFGGNWTCSNVKDQLSNVTWQQATTKVQNVNTIATLFCHINYYINIVTKVLQGGPLEGHDSLSFTHPPINSKEDWDTLVNTSLINAENFAALIEQLPDTILNENIANEKYGSYYRNLHGIIEHTHYHLGQIAIIKKMLPHNANKD